ncbi:hypothetical protein YDYSY3_47330 [Paenibacillus chitinolyticus]|uniref:DUF4180 domain-containing protein n=1 Tax=Paenibacillus chitinolyticus TaxID=79263 RepID=UPI0026E4CAF2|nr:DUF4180 domain-containing protein [Paenibacillus chitinolyticus]GKS13733.1 hypothetical protein YDYSY3_47330 [Paenibacillus chitinolyticus]
MNITVDQRQHSKVAVISSEDVVISSVNDALDLMADIRYNHECDKVLLRKEQLTEDFFELKTKLAGDILQKYINYQLKIAIVGDFSGYNSKSLNDFIYECNQGNNVFFKGTEAEALDALHGAKF